VVVINEPANSYKIDERETIIDLYKKLTTEASTGLISQRVNLKGEEVTDTFPNDKLTWQKISVNYSSKLEIGIKKSFPSFSNLDYHQKFIDEWESFASWFTEGGGKMISLVRNPIFTILSWKTTFDALKAPTKTQCKAWNRIVSKILLTKSMSPIFTYKEVVNNPQATVSKIAKYLEVPVLTSKKPPIVKQETNSLAYYTNVRKLKVDDLKSSLDEIVTVCNPLAQRLGYNLGAEIQKLYFDQGMETL